MALVRIYDNPRIMRFIRHGTRSPICDARSPSRDVHRFMDHWDAYGFGVWAVVVKATGALIGWCGLQYLPGVGEAELVYVLDEPYWNQGLATAAARASIEDGFLRVELHFYAWGCSG